ncbi:MAG: PadR family transcriptional regulator [Clostridium sp.]
MGRKSLSEISLYILLSMYIPRHGYGTMKFIKEKSKGKLILGAGTLYGAINNLSNSGYIQLYESNSSSDKKLYIITDLGKSIVSEEIENLKTLFNTFTLITRGDLIEKN